MGAGRSRGRRPALEAEATQAMRMFNLVPAGKGFPNCIVRVVGHVECRGEGGGGVKAPLSGEECAYFAYERREVRKVRKYSLRTGQHTDAEKSTRMGSKKDGCPFAVVEGGREVQVVKPCILAPATKFRSSTRDTIASKPFPTAEDIRVLQIRQLEFRRTCDEHKRRYAAEKQAFEAGQRSMRSNQAKGDGRRPPSKPRFRPYQPPPDQTIEFCSDPWIVETESILSAKSLVAALGVLTQDERQGCWILKPLHDLVLYREYIYANWPKMAAKWKEIQLVWDKMEKRNQSFVRDFGVIKMPAMKSGPTSSSSSYLGAEKAQEEELRAPGLVKIARVKYENQRYYPLSKWSPKLLPTDHSAFSDEKGRACERSPEGLEWRQEGDWEYAFDFPKKMIKYSWKKSKTNAWVRRRKWTTTHVCYPVQQKPQLDSVELRAETKKYHSEFPNRTKEIKRARIGQQAITEDVVDALATALSRRQLTGQDAKGAEEPLMMGNVRYFQPRQIQKLKVLGSGAFGEAWLANVTPYGEKKVVLKVPLAEGGLDDDSLRELGAMAALKPQKNIVEFVGAVTIDKKFCFITGYCARGSLDGLHSVIDMVREEKFLSVALDISEGLSHLHNNDIIHRDLACRNLLMKADGTVVICDYGLSKKLTDKRNSYRINTSKFPWPWTSPQSLKTQLFDKPGDVWSLGVTLWEILTRGKTPYAESLLAMSSAEVFSLNVSLDVIFALNLPPFIMLSNHALPPFPFISRSLV